MVRSTFAVAVQMTGLSQDELAAVLKVTPELAGKLMASEAMAEQSMWLDLAKYWKAFRDSAEGAVFSRGIIGYTPEVMHGLCINDTKGELAAGHGQPLGALAILESFKMLFETLPDYMDHLDDADDVEDDGEGDESPFIRLPTDAKQWN